MDENNITLGFCRACLIKYTDPMELIYYSEKNRRLFVYTTGLQVKHNDNFLFQLCKNCFFNMKIASKFKKLCRTSDKRFKTFMDLKKVESNLDFCNYIKNADTSYMYRMPTLYESSPNKPLADNDKDETASTSTSIRNFMKDILREEDIPATEAKIISQVIAEEADILEDSLDSHWLDDDDLTVNDDILDFSFSPFSTPKVDSNDRFTNFTNELHKNKEMNTKKYQFDVIVKTEEINMDIDDPKANSFTMDSIKTKNMKTFYNQSPMKTIHMNDNPTQDIPNKCVIDKNLAMALRNDSLEIPLDDLLKTPKAETPGSTTPLINKLLLDVENERSHSTPEYIRNLDKPISIDFDKYSNFDPDELLYGLNKTAFQKEDNIVYYETCKEEKQEDESPIDNIENNNEVSENEVANDNSFDIENCYCILCKLQFKTVQGLKVHAIRKHDYYMIRAEPTKRLKELMICDICDKQLYTDKGSFLRHIRTHTKVYKKIEAEYIEANEKYFDFENYYCKTCKLKFKGAKGLKVHAMKKHKVQLGLAERTKRTRHLMICDYCDKQMYTDKSNFIRHIQTHTKKIKKTYKCATCSSVFEKKSHLTMHSYHHMTPEERDKILEDKRKYICTKCGAKSSTAATLRLHMLRHTNNYKFECAICSKRFARSYELTVHMRNHTGATPYDCKTCNKAFKRRDQLTRHLVTHFYKYKCDNCEACFANETDYQKHKTMQRKCKSKENTKGKRSTVTKIKDNQMKPILDDLKEDESENQDVYLLYLK